MGDRFVTIVPQSTIAPLQRSVQNAAARLVFELGTREHVTASLLQLHWLLVTSPLASPVQAMLSYAFFLRKVSGLPVQHREACRPQSFTRRTTIFFNKKLRDAAATDKMWRSRLCSRWNALPEDMRAVSDSVVFSKRLKTHFLVLLLTFVD